MTTDKEGFYRDARDDLTGPLEGVKVLELTTTWAGPMAGCLLGDYGADVIKIEQPEGEIIRRLQPPIPGTDGRSLLNEVVNRNKRNLSLNLRDSEGRELALKLVELVDIVVENFRPGTLANWGLGFEDAKRVNPAIVYVSISGYGQFGPLSDRVGYDPLAQSFSGFLSVNGHPDGEPTKAPTFLGDDFSGIHAALAALAALRHRDRTGEGQHVDVSLVDAMLYSSSGSLAIGALGNPIPRMGNEYTIAAPINVYPCLDGYVYAGVLLESHWGRLATLIGRPELSDHPKFNSVSARIENREEVNEMLREWCADKAKQQIEHTFAELGLPAAPVQSYHEAAAHPHVLERDMLQEIEVGGRTVKVTGPAAKFSRTPVRVRTRAPDLGEHNEEILGALGFTAEGVAALKGKNVI